MSFIKINTQNYLGVCKYSNFKTITSFFNSKLIWMFEKKLKLVLDGEQNDESFLCPSYLQFPNLHHFDRVFNFLSIVTISLCNNTDIGIGSFVFCTLTVIVVCQNPYLPHFSPLFKNQLGLDSVYLSLDTVASLLYQLLISLLSIAVCKFPLFGNQISI